MGTIDLIFLIVIFLIWTVFIGYICYQDGRLKGKNIDVLDKFIGIKRKSPSLNNSSELKKLINMQQELIDGMEITIKLYEEYTGILDIEIGEELKAKKKKEISKKGTKK